MLVLAAFAFAATLGLSIWALLETVAGNRDKIVAALRGQSLLAGPTLVTRPVRVRIDSRRVSRPLTARPTLRQAA